MTKEEHKLIIRFLRKLDKELYQFIAATTLHINDYPKLILLFQAAKFHTTFGSIIELLNKFLPQDAEILMRSALNNLINALWIQKKDSDYRARRFVEYQVILQKKFIKSAIRYKKSKPLIKARQKEVADNLKKLTIKFGKNPRDWAGGSIHERAKEVSHGWDYDFVYSLASSNEHSDIISSKHYLDIDELAKEVKLFGGPTDKNLDAIAAASSGYTIKFVILLNKTFKLQKRKKIRKLMDEFMSMFKKTPQTI